MSAAEHEQQWRDWFQLLALEAPDWDLETIQDALALSLQSRFDETAARAAATERQRNVNTIRQHARNQRLDSLRCVLELSANAIERGETA